MVQDFEKLLSLCDEELKDREYNAGYYARLSANWNRLSSWMSLHELKEFSEEVGNRYLEEIYGTHLLPVKANSSVHEGFRAVRMLVSYQKRGEFEFRSPRVEHTFDGFVGQIAMDYLNYCRHDRCLSERTLESKKLYLYAFSMYMDCASLDFSYLSTDEIEKFFTAQKYSLSSRHNCACTIRSFLQYVYNVGKSEKDCSVYVLKDSYRKNCKLPTTYEEDEIRNMLDAVERASAIGKRDYLILLLATEYGWRAKDITEFCFNQIDWENNVIWLEQSKTGIPVEFPLLASVGNAIIDYLKHGRPETDAPEIIVSLNHETIGKPLKSPTIHSVVSRYLKKANVKDWSRKKHGPHSMRHSLATNLLKKNVALPIISTVMGHQKTDTTRVYISVDYDKLKQCALPMPPLHSPLYGKEVPYGKI